MGAGVTVGAGALRGAGGAAERPLFVVAFAVFAADGALGFAGLVGFVAFAGGRFDAAVCFFVLLLVFTVSSRMRACPRARRSARTVASRIGGPVDGASAGAAPRGHYAAW